MLYDELKKLSYMRPNGEYYLVFHTSILNFSQIMLDKIANELPYEWLLPENVFYELTLLKRSKLFGKKAEQILDLAKKKHAFDTNGNPILCCNLEDFYAPQNEITKFAERYTSLLLFSANANYIFIFGNQLKLKEFLTYIADRKNYFVFFHNRWSQNGYSSEDTITDVATAKNWISLLDCERLAKNVIEKKRILKKIDSEALITARNADDGFLRYYRMSEDVNSGGEGWIFTATGDPNMILKLYKEKLSANHLRKIKHLIKISTMNHLETYLKYVMFPRELLYVEDEPVGIGITKVRGCSLTDAIVDPDAEVDLVKVIKDLALTLLELNLCYIQVADLDMDNLMLDIHGNVYLIDTDSFQYMHYGSGVLIRPDYRHKDLVNKNTILYLPMHQDFAFCVLLFKLLVCGTSSPLYQKAAIEAAEQKQLFWGGGFEFPYVENASENTNVNQYHHRRWKDLPNQFQRAFTEAFHFRRTFSIGHMMKIFDEEV